MTRTVTPERHSSASKNRSETGASNAELAALWDEARHAYPIYAAMTAQFGLARLPHGEGELPPARPTREVFDRDMQWLDEIDEKIKAFQLRQLLPDALNTSEQSLRAFTIRQLRKPKKDNSDRDKIDFLIVQYFALCAPDRLYHEQIQLSDVAEVIKPILQEADPTPLEWCEPLEQILDSVKNCISLRDLMERGLLEQGRILKESAGALFYDPAALVAFCRFNFLLRRSFILLLHADQRAVLDAIGRLESQGIKAVDCRRAGFSAAEPLKRIRQFAESWRQPYHKDYSETSVTRAYEQLLALRADLEDAVWPKTSTAEPVPPSLDAIFAPPENAIRSATPAAVANPPVTVEKPTPAPKRQQTVTADAPTKQAPATEAAKPAGPQSGKPQGTAAKADIAAAPSIQTEIENCTESIWEQLLDAPPSRGRSMSTVVLKDTKVLLSSWEVAAFLSEGGQDSADIRRAVVARALLAVAIDVRKRSGESNSLESALTLARTEVSYFQGRVEESKRSKNTEAAVNLGISTKRLLSFIEEAESLRP